MTSSGSTNGSRSPLENVAAATWRRRIPAWRSSTSSSGNRRTAPFAGQIHWARSEIQTPCSTCTRTSVRTPPMSAKLRQRGNSRRPRSTRSFVVIWPRSSAAGTSTRSPMPRPSAPTADSAAPISTWTWNSSESPIRWWTGARSWRGSSTRCTRNWPSILVRWTLRARPISLCSTRRAERSSRSTSLCGSAMGDGVSRPRGHGPTRQERAAASH